MERGTTDIRILRSGVQRALFAGGGYLLLATANDVQAMTFDPQALLLTGSSDAMPGMTPQFAASDSTLALVRASAPHERVWSDGAGASAIARMTSLAIAPDSRHVAGVIAEGSDADIWIADLASGAVTRLTFGGTNVSPAWSADGERVYFATRTGTGPYRVVSDTIDRGNTATALTGAPPQAFPTSAAADGRVAATIYNNGRTGVAILGANERAPRLLDDGPFDEANAVFSPDGRDLALESSASGRTEVVVRSLADGRRLQISRDGGTRPQWSEDGRMLYFFAGRRVMKVTFATRDVTAASPPEVVFDRADARPVAVTPSGRVLVDRQPASDTALAVLHWLSELRARLPLPVNAPR
jgi:dipeptidyl aminopeptidase/acylaminoacyl peptidase